MGNTKSHPDGWKWVTIQDLARLEDEGGLSERFLNEIPQRVNYVFYTVCGTRMVAGSDNEITSLRIKDHIRRLANNYPHNRKMLLDKYQLSLIV